MDAHVLNAGLDFAMEFGANWLRPIQTRLAAKFPQLSPQELDTYDQVCREAMRFGHQQVAAQIQPSGGSKDEHFRLVKVALLARYPWMTSKNLDHLFSQGCYYAWKDGAF